MRTRLVALLAVATAMVASLMFAAPASAYGPDGCTLHVVITPAHLTAGAPFTVTISGDCADRTFDIIIHSAPVQLGTTTTDSNGDATFSGTLPSTLSAGAHTLQVVDQKSGRVFQKGVAVAGGSVGASSGSGLPFTGGNDIWQLTAAGAGLVLGATALVVVRRRRAHSGLAA